MTMDRMVERSSEDFYTWAKATGEYSVVDNSVSKIVRCPYEGCGKAIWKHEHPTLPYDAVSKCFRCPYCGVRL